MANQKNYAFTDLSVKNSLYLEIEGAKYAVSQFSSSNAANEIPMAQCLIAIGRDAQSQGAAEKATIHTNHNYRTMTKCKVVFSPSGEFSPDGTKWPEGERVIFRGYFMGFQYRKMNGKIQAVANLLHWLADMACSSALTKNGHVSNPTQLNTAAIFPGLRSTGTQQVYYISSLPGIQLAEPKVSTDVWGAIKDIFCALANRPTTPTGGRVDGSGDAKKNDRALQALKLMEGDSADCPFTPTDGSQRYSVPLKIVDLTDIIMKRSVCSAISHDMLESYANNTFWDKLVNQFCPMFGMAVVPMVERALVIADTPAYRGGFWKEIQHTEYDSMDMPSMLDRPMRAVAVYVDRDSQTKAAVNARAGKMILFGGTYVEDSVDPADGVVQVVTSPPWLRMAHSIGQWAGETTSLAPNKDGTPETFGQLANAMYAKYAHTVYANNMLRGRNGALAGKLRFDIAPGSILKIQQKAEQFLGAEDDLAATLIACVSRVTVSINAEAGQASTVFHLTAMRREDPENQENRTSVAEHPLFGNSIHGGGKHGSPLIPDYDLSGGGGTPMAGEPTQNTGGIV